MSTQKFYLLTILLATSSLIFLIGCGSSSGKRDLAYESNPFWFDDPQRPAHPKKKARVDFFDKVCSPSSGNSFDCKYTDDP